MWCVRGEVQDYPDQHQPGFSGPGSFAELVAVPAADLNVVGLPDALSFIDAAAADGSRAGLGTLDPRLAWDGGA